MALPYFDPEVSEANRTWVRLEVEREIERMGGRAALEAEYLSRMPVLDSQTTPAAKLDAVDFARYELGPNADPNLTFVVLEYEERRLQTLELLVKFHSDAEAEYRSRIELATAAADAQALELKSQNEQINLDRQTTQQLHVGQTLLRAQSEYQALVEKKRLIQQALLAASNN
ncbi:hypothetical protein BASA81_004046 [Batrachochytrium salamandrivorans]|nr:hypothetical protein BASA81_004046 [Batrachochytrium salamandrivorans]